MARVLITGAAGLIGGVLWRGLGGSYDLCGLDRARRRERGIVRGDVRRPRSLARVLDGVDVVVDLASGSRADLPWDDVLEDCAGRVNLLEAARAHGVRRYVFASSNHVTGLYEADHPYAEIVAGRYDGLDPHATPLIDPAAPPRPDGPYAVGKLLGEGAARLYAERHDVSAICLRLGTVTREGHPTRPRHFATLLTHDDLVRLVACAIDAPDSLRFGVYYGVSANTWRFWAIRNARDELGYEPQDDAERFRELTAVAR